METLNLETTAPFQGLSELVAYNEGLFAEEGIDITWVDRDPTENVVGITKTINTDIKDPSEVDPHSSHGKLFEQGKADMYNACEWGNYCRVQDSGIESGRQIGRRSIVTFAGLVVSLHNNLLVSW